MNKPLVLKETKTTMQSGEWGLIKDIDLLALIENLHLDVSKVIIWAVNEVKWGYYSDNQFNFSDSTKELDLRYLQEMRIFNKSEELKISVQNNKVSYRYIKDDTNDGLMTKYVDSTSRLLGKNEDCANVSKGFISLIDKGRKLSQIVPFETIRKECYLTTRNYIGYLENHQASYVDYRYLEITDKEL